jgi:hypothetical protein
MCRGKNGKNKKNKDQCKSYEGAILNKDRCYATPAFILPSEKVQPPPRRSTTCRARANFYATTSGRCVNTRSSWTNWYAPFQVVRAQAALQKHALQRLPLELRIIHRGTSFLTQHIKSSSHKANIRASNFNTYILELQDSFKMKHPKDTTLSSTEPSPRFSQDEEVQIIGSTGRKKVKQNTELAASPAFQTYPLPLPAINYPPPPVSYPPPSMYLPSQSMQFRGFDGFNNCRTFMNSYPASPYTFFPYMQGGFNYPMYCIPFQPMMTMDIYQPPL